MELRGLEPLTYALPARRSSQLSYSPVECDVVSKVNACLLSIARGRQTEQEKRSAGNSARRDELRHVESVIGGERTAIEGDAE